MTDEMLRIAKQILQETQALFIGAGAGMGVDSGLPDFRGNQGFWKAYPIAQRLGLSFVDLANPRWFKNDPHLAWAFYGHRLQLYRQTQPHSGFGRLLQFAEQLPGKYFVFTSNVDGHFQKAGFAEERVVEVHGSIHFLQCTVPCTDDIWSAEQVNVEIDMNDFRAKDPLPTCPHCEQIARPNILMFGDWQWLSHRTEIQEQRMHQWLREVYRKGLRLTVLEFGAGTAVPTVRYMCERVADEAQSLLIRVNPREWEVPEGHLGLALGAKEAIERLIEV